jgi:competence ComEA-like helix-hairpin-helix protein
MFKDFFYFTKSQRVGIVVLLVLIVLLLLADLFLPYLLPTPKESDTAFIAKVEAFKKTLVDRDSLRQLQWKSKYNSQWSKFNTPTYSLFTFDPNTLDSSGFVRLGLKPYIASNILKYRAHGGKFRMSNDFARVYGITPAKFEELQPYISIERTTYPHSDSLIHSKKELKQELIVDINKADTSELKKVRGIGAGYAKKIVGYRKVLGGYVKVDQLIEIYGMTSENYEKIKASCKVNASDIQQIKVNVASVQRLSAHPYLRFYKAKAIYEQRREKGKLHGISEIAALPVFTKEDIEKIEPYLSFE